jgi:hypothetical protein
MKTFIQIKEIAMKNSLSKIVAVTFYILMMADAHAEIPYNLDIGYTKIYYKEPGTPTFTPDHIMFSVSQDGFEAIASIGVNSKTKNVNGNSITATVPSIFGVFYKPDCCGLWGEFIR